MRFQHKLNSNNLSDDFAKLLSEIEILPEQEGTLTYTGEEQYPTWQNLDPLKLLVEGEKSAVNAGKHYITVTPMGNFAWIDDTQTPKTIE